MAATEGATLDSFSIVPTGNSPVSTPITMSETSTTMTSINESLSPFAEQKSVSSARCNALFRTPAAAVVEDLATCSSPRNFDDYTPLLIASRKGHLPIVRLLCQNGAELEARDKDGLTSLHHACQQGHVEVVKFLLSMGADLETLDAAGNSVFHGAVLKEMVDVLQILLESCQHRPGGSKAYLDMKDSAGRTSLLLASDIGRDDIAMLLIEYGASVQ